MIKIPAFAVFIAMLALVGAGAADAAGKPVPPAVTAPMLDPVRAWVDAFNSATQTYPENAFTSDAIVQDQFGIFAWTQGSGGARKWWYDLVGRTREEHQRFLAYHQHLDLSDPQFAHIKPDRAFFVMPATLTWVQQGTKHTMTARWIVTEVKTASGWRINSHAWAPLTETP